jgi:hypothetical protein
MLQEAVLCQSIQAGAVTKFVASGQADIYVIEAATGLEEDRSSDLCATRSCSEIFSAMTKIVSPRQQLLRLALFAVNAPRLAPIRASVARPVCVATDGPVAMPKGFSRGGGGVHP